MKKIILAFVVFSCVSAKAQYSTARIVPEFKPYHDVRFTVGTQKYEIILPQIFENFGCIDEVSSFSFHPDTYYDAAVYTTGSFSASYIYHTTENVGIGATIAYGSYYNNFLDAETSAIIGKSVRNHIGLFPRVNYTWLNRPKFSIYSSAGLGLGLVFRNNTVDEVRTRKTYWNLTGQYTLLGFTVGQKVYAIGEILGWGTEGIVKVGVGYRFNSFKKP
jgi:hypothetical protein